MTIRATNNGQDSDKLQAEFDRLLTEYAETNDPKVELQLIKLYEQTTGFKPDCCVCIAGRRKFVKSLQDFKSGNVLEGLNAMKASMTSVKVKWHILSKKWLKS